MQSELEYKSHRKYYLSNRDLLIIAILSGIGGVMSTYVGYLGNFLNRLFGVPFGAGQFLSGLHIFWIILAAGLVRLPGAATAAGLLKGVIELFTGSTHGVAIVFVSLAQGLFVDLVLLLLRRHSLPVYALAGGMGSASNVLVFQALYFSGAPLSYILFIAGLSFFSGILFGGGFGHGVLEIVRQVRPFRLGTGLAGSASQVSAKAFSRRLRVVGLVLTILFAVVFSAGAVYYFAAIYESPWSGPECLVEGKVERPLNFQLSRFAGQETTIVAELVGEVTYIPPEEYTGIPVKVILEAVLPKPEASLVKVIANDGYMVEFPLEEALSDEAMLLIQENSALRLIAGNYSGGYWVKQVNKFVVE
ncbi:MAG: ECF transporter S component [Dethiobacteria bacterium]|jgi:ABC-type thiamin/hydroxymethylpyrimidine transport system permease subunit